MPGTVVVQNALVAVPLAVSVLCLLHHRTWTSRIEHAPGSAHVVIAGHRVCHGMCVLCVRVCVYVLWVPVWVLCTCVPELIQVCMTSTLQASG